MGPPIESFAALPSMEGDDNVSHSPSFTYNLNFYIDQPLVAQALDLV
jgi:hypothetical protein